MPTGLRIRCKRCRRQFTPRRGTRRITCYDCRPERTTTSEPAAPPSPLGVEGEMYSAVLGELREMDPPQDRSIAGVAALRLARALDDPRLGAAQVSSMTAQLLRTVEPLRQFRRREPDRLDEFSERAARKAQAAGG